MTTVFALGIMALIGWIANTGHILIAAIVLLAVFFVAGLAGYTPPAAARARRYRRRWRFWRWWW